MATKKQVITALKNHTPDATLIIDDGTDTFQLQFEAPKGHHWEGSTHCHILPEWFKGTAPRSEYWKFALYEIECSLPKAVPCVDNDCEGIRQFGECDYWE